MYSYLHHIQVDCQERGLREEDWNDPIDSREEGTQKYASKSANAAAALKKSAIITDAEINAVIASPVTPVAATSAKKGSNAKVRAYGHISFLSLCNLELFTLSFHSHVPFILIISLPFN